MRDRPEDIAARRAKARVAAIFVGLIALAVYVGFMVLTWFRANG